MSELAVALLLAALITPSSVPMAVGTPTPVSAQTAVAPRQADTPARTAREVQEAQRRDKRNDDTKPDVKGPAVAQAPAATK
jgi:hypothetical protein